MGDLRSRPTESSSVQTDVLQERPTVGVGESILPNNRVCGTDRGTEPRLRLMELSVCINIFYLARYS